MYTLEDLQKIIKRRLRQLRTTTAATAEVESGFEYSDFAITDAINAGRAKISGSLADAGYFTRQIDSITTVADQQAYDLPATLQRIESAIWDYTLDGTPANAVDLVQIASIKDEIEIIKDTTAYNPNETDEGYFRVIAGSSVSLPRINILVSRDGTVTESKKVHIEFTGDLALLDNTTPTGDTNLTNQMNELVVLWALKVLTEKVDSSVSEIFKQGFNNSANVLNANKGVRNG